MGTAVNVAYDEAKLAEMILYVADFAHVRKTGAPISGAD